MNIFIIESPNPVDRTRERTEIKGLVALGKMFRHHVTSFDVLSRSDFQKIIKYISSIDSDESSGKIHEDIAVHISCHGNTEGLGFGTDFVPWTELADILSDLSQPEFSEKVLLSISSCGTSKQRLTAAFNKVSKKGEQIYPPSFVVFFDQNTVAWDDSLISWGLFYHNLGKHENNVLTRSNLISVIDFVRSTKITELSYHRWDVTANKYYKYPKKM